MFAVIFFPDKDCILLSIKPICFQVFFSVKSKLSPHSTSIDKWGLYGDGNKFFPGTGGDGKRTFCGDGNWMVMGGDGNEINRVGWQWL